MDSVKPRFATAWLAGCSGCHMSFLDLDERLIALSGLVDVCYTPIADIKEFPENVDIAMVEGAVANEDNLREIKTIRKRAKILVAFGDCAVTGNVTAMRNMFQLEDVLNTAYRQSAVVNGVPPDGGVVPRLLDKVRRVHDVVDVDYYLPGCPPSADRIHDFVVKLLSGEKPEGGRFGA